jgi:hypothetical protein
MGMKSQVYHGKNYDKAIDDNVWTVEISLT